MKQEELQAIKEQYDNMDWEDFRENAGDLITREIEIYNDVVIEGVPALIAEVERLREALEFYADDENWLPSIDMPFEVDDYCSEIDLDKGKLARQALDGE